jgi:hypothetical protein
VAAEQIAEEGRRGVEQLGAHPEDELNQVCHSLRISRHHDNEKRQYQHYQQ